MTTTMNIVRKASAAALLAGVLFGASACNADNGALPERTNSPTATAAATPSAAAPAITGPATAKATLDAEEAQSIKSQFAKTPLAGLDPAKVAVPAEVKAAFGTKDASTASLAGMKFIAALDGMRDLQAANHTVSAADDFTLDNSIAPLAEANYYKTFKTNYHGAKPSAVISFWNAKGAATVDGKSCTPRDGGFNFRYSSPSLVMNTNTSPDSAAFAARTVVSVPCTEGGVAVRTVDRYISMLPVSGEWKVVGDYAAVQGTTQVLR